MNRCCYQPRSNEGPDRVITSKSGFLSGILVFILSACATIDNEVAKRLKIDSRTTQRYHYLAENPFGYGLLHEGYLIGIEKAFKELVYTGDSDPYYYLFRPYPKDGRSENEQIDADRASHLEGVVDDSKTLFVSHILAYEPDDAESTTSETHGHSAQRRFRTRFVYNIHPSDYGGQTYSPYDGVEIIDPNPSNEYLTGWEALQKSLSQEIPIKIKNAAESNNPYTHLFVGAMGWDNDQIESLNRYNAIIGNLITAARTDSDQNVQFNPLFIGMTWPSVWGWQSWFDLAQLAYKVFGYGNKANDADEIGYTLANWLVNDLALGVKVRSREEGHPLKIVVFGHSFGSRITSRAMFSRDLFKNGAPFPEEKVDLLIGLQGAFSANRFIPGEGEEGSPYRDFAQIKTPIIMSWSENDKANPLAYWITRAPLIGGYRGYQTAVEKGQEIFEQIDAKGIVPQHCGRLRRGDRVFMVDASGYVEDHGDVLDIQMGKLMWLATKCISF